MDPTKCFICEKPFATSETEFIGKGIPTLIAASRARKDNKYELLQKVEIIQVHKNCKSEYTNKENIRLLLKRTRTDTDDLKHSAPKQVISDDDPLKKSAPKKVSSDLQKSAPKQISKDNPPKQISKDTENLQEAASTSGFDFEARCFFCEKLLANELKKPRNRRRSFHLCTQLSLKEKVIEQALERNDTLGNQLLNRIKNVDLMLVKAQYHDECKRKFFYAPSKLKKGRPEDQTLSIAFEKVCDYINESEERQFTLKSLLEMVENNLPDNSSMSMKTLKAKLLKKYGDGIVVATSLIKPSAIYFLDHGLKQREEMVKQKMMLKE